MTASWSEASSEVIHIAERLIKNITRTCCKPTSASCSGAKRRSRRVRFVFAQASTVPAKMKAYMDYDFIIWIAEKEFERMYTGARTALIDHELCHCIGFEDRVENSRP